MKRLLSLLLCLLLCLTLLPAAHAEEASLVLTAALEEGDIVLILSAAEDLSGVCGLHVRYIVPEGFAYDTQRPIQIHEGFNNLTANKDQLDFAMESTKNPVDIEAGEAIVTMYLTVPEEFEPGIYHFAVEIAEAYDWDFEDYPFRGQTFEADYEKPFPPPVIVQQPQSAVAAVGETVSFTALCDNLIAAYCWYYRSGENAEWTVCSDPGWNTDTLTVEAELSCSGYQYRCEASCRSGSVLSEAATLTVQQAPSITAQPQSVTAEAGTTASFAVTAEGTDLSYEWQYRTSASGSWNKYSGGSGTLTIEAKSYRNGYQYRCVVTNSLGSVTSEAATLTVR